jgi:hypothetical protein
MQCNANDVVSELERDDRQPNPSSVSSQGICWWVRLGLMLLLMNEERVRLNTSLGYVFASFTMPMKP